MIADLYNKNELRKIIKKDYLKNNQNLYIDSIEVRYGCDSCLDIFIYDKEFKNFKKFLFTIFTYEFLQDVEFPLGNTDFMYKTFDYMTASIRPYYFDRCYFLRKNTTITLDDIYNCACHFIEKELEMYLIFNKKVNLKQEDCNGVL